MARWKLGGRRLSAGGIASAAGQGVRHSGRAPGCHRGLLLAWRSDLGNGRLSRPGAPRLFWRWPAAQTGLTLHWHRKQHGQSIASTGIAYRRDRWITCCVKQVACRSAEGECPTGEYHRIVSLLLPGSQPPLLDEVLATLLYQLSCGGSSSSSQTRQVWTCAAVRNQACCCAHGPARRLSTADVPLHCYGAS
jgi:hypothetical protein